MRFNSWDFHTVTLENLCENSHKIIQVKHTTFTFFEYANKGTFNFTH